MMTRVTFAKYLLGFLMQRMVVRSVTMYSSLESDDNPYNLQKNAKLKIGLQALDDEHVWEQT